MADRPTRAVVLGGGGLTGIAWLTGILHSLERADISLADADLILGTSAGSIVGAQLAARRDFGRLYAFLGSDRVPARSALLGVYGRMPSPDAGSVEQMARAWHDLEATTPQQRAAAGRAALRATTMPERAFVGLLAAFLHMRRWPGAAFGATVVDAIDGSVRVLRETDGVAVARAIAASSAVPEVYPPVHIGGRPYVDGGTGSVTNAELAAGHDLVLVFVDHRLADGAGPMSRTALDVELATLRAGGAQVVVVEPDVPSLDALGEFAALDPARIQPAAQAGRAQGVAEAARLRAAWLRPA